MVNVYKFIDAEMHDIQANLKPAIKEEILEFCDTVSDAFDKLSTMAALYVDMCEFLKHLSEMKPRCGCEGAHFCPDDNLHYPPTLCAYHNSRLANRERTYQDWLKAEELDADDDLPF